MAKVMTWLKDVLGALVALIGVFIGVKLLRKGESGGNTKAAEAAREEQKLTDVEAAQDAARQVAIRNEEKRQDGIKAQVAVVQSQVDAETKRIEGLSRDAVETELRSLDTTSPAAPAVIVPPAPDTTPKS